MLNSSLREVLARFVLLNLFSLVISNSSWIWKSPHKKNAREKQRTFPSHHHVRSAHSPRVHFEESPRIYQGFSHRCELWVHRQRVRVASDGFLARFFGGVDVTKHRFWPLPMRPRRDHGDELVEHGAFRTHLCLLCIALDRFDNDREMQRIRDDRVVSKKSKVCCRGFPNEQKSHIFEFFQRNPIFFLSLLRARETTGAAKERERSFRWTRRRRLVVCAMKVTMRESDRRKQGQLFLLFVFERSYVLNERERETDQSQKSSSFRYNFLFRHDNRAKC